MSTERESMESGVGTTESAKQDLWHVVQRVMFASPNPKAPNELYARGLTGAVRCERRRVVVEPDARVSTNTYFGRLPASYLQRWTPIRKLDLVLRVKGAGRVEIHASDDEGAPRILSTLEVLAKSEREVRLPAVLDRFMDGGFIWLEAVTTGEEMTVSDVRWVVSDAPARARPTSIVICTYNRADDCLNTMRAIGEDTELLRILDRVYVVDQGDDTVASRDSFDKVVALYHDKLCYLQQPNLGGAGGFTRGMFEVTQDPLAEQANVLFMDDDVLLEPETALRLTAFANHATQPTIVGGQMLYLYHPNRLHVMAETADLARLRPGVLTDGARGNVNLSKKLPHRRVNAGYNGWWSCLIPPEVISRVGLPLPAFFQWDDVEYGFRARHHGVATVTLPGSAVWHADFAWKDWDDWSRYFNIRNSMITAALHSEFDVRRICSELAEQLAHYLVGMQYGMAATLLMAVEDFLAGPAVLDDGGVKAAADIRVVRARYPDTHRRTLDELEVEGASTMPIIEDPGEPSLPTAIMAKRLVYILTGRTGGAAEVRARDSRWWHVSLFKTALVTDSAQDSFRVRQFDRPALTSLTKEGARLLLRLARERRAVRDSWREALPQLTSRENWERLFASSR